ncbi:MAG: hypothetical protein M1820_003478 [Bogoriella megaspora]|nr:MAG: hypothetical protein M1820_003478 [Bogoriella megaspora]
MYRLPLLTILQQGTLPNAARAVLSLLKRYQHGQLQANQWDEFMSLESHVKKIKAQGKSGEDTFDVISYGILQLLGAEKAGFGLQLVQQCLGMVMTNALTIVTPVFDPVGMCVDPLISKANHSCDPNAVVVFDGPRLSLRSLRPINSNEEIFISYIDSTDPRSRRQEQLMTRYHFICVCSKCQNDQIHIPGDNDQLTTLPPVYDPAFTHAEIEGWVILEKVKKSDPSSAISMLETALFGLQKENIRPLTRQPGPSLRQQLLVNFLSAGRYLDALHQGFLIYFGVDPTLFPEPFHPVRVVHNWTLANLIVYITGEQHDGRVIELQRRGVDWGVALYGIVKEVLENVAKSHGPESRFADAVKTAAAQMLKDATSGAGVELDAFDDRLGEQRVLLRQLFLNGAVQ